jgi:membrane protein
MLMPGGLHCIAPFHKRHLCRQYHLAGEMTQSRLFTGKQYQSRRQLPGLPTGQLIRNVASAVRMNDFLGRASELASDFLFALFPLIVMMLALFGLFASHSLELQNDLLAYFSDFLPPLAFQLLKDTTVELAQDAGGGMLTFGIVTSLWFASGGVNSMISALNLSYRVGEARSWFKVRAVAI